MSGRKDPAWKYGQEVDMEGSKGYKYIQCNFCQKILKGGVFRMKEHLAGIHGNAAPCLLVPPEVRDEIKNYLDKHSEAKKMAQMCREERIDQGVSLYKSSSGSVSNTSRRGVRGPMDRFLQNVEEGEDEGNPVVITASEKELRDRTAQDIGRFFFENGIAFNVANSPSFINMLRSVGNFGRGLKPPTPYELSTTILNKEVDSTKEVVDSLKISWKRTGVSIMSDGWKDMRGRQLINFLVNNPKGTVFLKSVDASDVVKDANLLFKLLDEVVEEVGEDIVLQVVTDNAANYKKAGELLMQKRKRLWWTPCAAHCIDLMLEDIGKLPQHKNALIKAKKVSTFIYNHGAVLALMRSFTKKDLVRPAPTRFATAYLTLQSMYSLKQNLEQMFTSKEWNELSLSKKHEGREVKKIIWSGRFWISMAYALKTTKPLVGVLRMMDGEKMPGMGLIYGAMDKAKEEIAKNLGDEVGAYKEIWKIIDNRWEFQMHRHLHAAAYFLNPQIQYSENPSRHPEIKLGFFMCIDKLLTNDEDKTKADVQVDAFINKTGMFSFGQAKNSIFNRSPGM